MTATEAAPTSAAATRLRNKRRRPRFSSADGRGRARRDPLALMAVPALLWYGVFTVGPLVAMFWLSVRDWRGLLAQSSFVGLAKYSEVLSDSLFWSAARNTGVQLLVVLPIMLPLAFALGYYLAQNPRGHSFLRVAFFTPALISLAAKSMIFLSLFAPNGMINNVLQQVGLDFLTTAWLANRSTALGVIIAVDLWGGVGFTAVLFAARIAGIPREVMDAAALDGARQGSLIWKIAYPICREYFGVILMLQFIWILFSSAGQVLLLTRGGPGNASTTLSFLVYDTAFARSDIGYSQAVAVILFGVGGIGVWLIRRTFSSLEG